MDGPVNRRAHAVESDRPYQSEELTGNRSQPIAPGTSRARGGLPLGFFVNWCSLVTGHLDLDLRNPARESAGMRFVVNGEEILGPGDGSDGRQWPPAPQARRDEKDAGSTDPLAPASRIPARGLVGTDPVTMAWIALLIAGVLMLFFLPLVALVRHFLP